MNKNAIKKFAIDARKKLIASVSDRAGMLGITPEGCSEPISKGIDFEVYKTVAGTEVTLGRTQCEQRRKLKEQIETRGFEAVVEEVAYTWFNRICAIRFMEVNDYLPTRVRVLSSEKEGKNEPDIVTQAPDVDLDFTDKEREYILDCKMNNKLDELFKMLFIKQCNKLSEILPELFEATEDYTEMLLNISYTNKDDIVHMLVNQEAGIPEADFNVSSIGEDGEPTGQVEIIGWLYQYYNTELKDDTFAQLKKNVKISKERIPAATQLFTPDWIVRYMVENSVGRLWIEHLRAVDPAVNEKEVAERFGWKYYLPEAEQEADVNIKLAEIRSSYKDLKPEDITCIDPCMGSGHILVAMFDVLMDIYKSAGYSERDAAFEIVEHNIHGLDIDKRAYQLAYFAVMMKGRGYNRRFFNGRNDSKLILNVCNVVESNNVQISHLKYFGNTLPSQERKRAEEQLEYLIELFCDAREYGSILCIKKCDWELLDSYLDDINNLGQLSIDSVGCEITQKLLRYIVVEAKVMSRTYMVTITNPPYMGSSGMNSKITKFVKKNYPDSKSDLFAIFIERCKRFTQPKGYYSMITQHAWMFLVSYEKLRGILRDNRLLNLIHLGAHAFDELGGEIVQSVTFTFQNISVNNSKTVFERLLKFGSEEEKKTAYLRKENSYVKEVDSFDNVPGRLFAYWLSDKELSAFDVEHIGETYKARQGMSTTDNERFVRKWYEIEFDKISFSGEKQYDWFLYNKSGEYRRWYGNLYHIVNYENSGEVLIELVRGKYPNISDPEFIIKNRKFYFKEALTWSMVSTNNFAARYVPSGAIFDISSPCLFDVNSPYLMLGLLNSTFYNKLLNVINPTMNYNVGDVENLPLPSISDSIKQRIEELVIRNIELSKEEWDSYEVSWGFSTNPLVKSGKKKISEAYLEWETICQERLEEVRKNEEELNALVNKIFDVDLDPTVKTEEVTLRLASVQNSIKELISFAIGCIFGRYSLLEGGIILDGNKENGLNEVVDICIPITDEEYLKGDIVSKFVDFIKIAFGECNLEENLCYIADALEIQGESARDTIRNYFVKEFYYDHLKMYQKRPIYWMFDSGKQNGFKALMYIHKYTEDVVGTLRVDYLHRVQEQINSSLNNALYVINNSQSSKEKARATKISNKLQKQLAELTLYDEAVAHVANMRLSLKLTDGVKCNYEKFQNVVVSKEGKKAQTINLLGKM